MCFPRKLRRLYIQAKWTVVTSCLDGPFYTCVRERVLIKGVLIFVYEHTPAPRSNAYLPPSKCMYVYDETLVDGPRNPVLYQHIRYITDPAFIGANTPSCKERLRL